LRLIILPGFPYSVAEYEYVCKGAVVQAKRRLSRAFRPLQEFGHTRKQVDAKLEK